MNIELSTTNYQIIQSGTIIVPNEEFLEFKIENLYFRFLFENNVTENQKVKESSYKLAISEDNKRLDIKLINMSDTINATNTEIMNVASIKGKQLFLKFCVTSINKNNQHCDYLFSYTWYLSNI